MAPPPERPRGVNYVVSVRFTRNPAPTQEDPGLMAVNSRTRSARKLSSVETSEEVTTPEETPEETVSEETPEETRTFYGPYAQMVAETVTELPASARHGRAGKGSVFEPLMAILRQSHTEGGAIKKITPPVDNTPAEINRMTNALRNSADKAGLSVTIAKDVEEDKVTFYVVGLEKKTRKPQS